MIFSRYVFIIALILFYYTSHLSSNQLQSIAYLGYVKVHSSVQAGYWDEPKQNKAGSKD